MKTLKYITILVLLCLLVSCGFRLQGKYQFSNFIKKIDLISSNPYSGLLIDLRQRLIDNGINIRRDADIKLKISNESFSHDNSNLVSSIQATVYTFRYSFVFALYNKNNDIILNKQTVSSSKTITLNPNEVLNTSNEAFVIKRELIEDTISKMFNILSSRIAHENISKSIKTFSK